jgi:GT2 family glycosyltransferase
MSESRFTVVVAPRETFSKSKASLESVFASTNEPFDLVYIDGQTPPAVHGWLEEQAHKRGFRLIRADHLLAGNEARNLGLACASTEYIIFIDNDVIVAPGCFEALIACAEETGAAVVGPLYLNSDPGEQTIHTAGADLTVAETNGRHFLHERHHFSGKGYAATKASLVRSPVDLVEFHCLLARRDLFARLGPLDEGLVSFFDHIDFCLAVRETGATVYLEPAAVVTHLAPPPFEQMDVPYFLLRWSDAWLRPSMEHFAKKRSFRLSDEFINAHLRYRDAHRRRLLRNFRKTTQRLIGARGLAATDMVLDRLIFGGWIERTSVRRLEATRQRLAAPAAR